MMGFALVWGVIMIVFLYESNERKYVKNEVRHREKIYKLEQENKKLRLQLQAAPYEKES